MPTKKPSTEPPAEPAAESPETAPTTGNRFFSWIRSIDLRRETGWIGGVCAGIATRLGIDPIIVRGIAVVLAVLGGPALLLYAAAWLVLPDANDKIHLEEVIRGRLEPAIAGIAAFFVLSLLPVTQGFWFLGAGFWGAPEWGDAVGRAIWTIVLLGLLVWFIVWLARRGDATIPWQQRATHQPWQHRARATEPKDATPASAAFVASDTAVTAPTTPPTNATEPELAEWRAQQERVRAEQQAFRNQQASDRAAANRAAAEEAQRERAAQREKDRAAYAATRSHPLYSLIVIGLALVVGGLVCVSGVDGVPTSGSITLGLAATLAVLAVGMIVNGVRGKRSGGAAGVAVIVLIPLALGAGFFTGQFRWAAASTLAPHSSQDYYYGGGQLTLDLTHLDSTDRTQQVNLYLGAGDVTVLVPADTGVYFSSTVGAGSIDAGPQEDSTRVGPVERTTATFGPENTTDIVVTVQVGAGEVRVVQEGANR